MTIMELMAKLAKIEAAHGNLPVVLMGDPPKPLDVDAVVILESDSGDEVSVALGYEWPEA